jgi:IclR family transcriptional regulator, KDG regulon repressor
MKDPNEYNVRAVERALQILECFDIDHPERGISEIAGVVNLHKATVHRIVTTLVNYGFMERTEDGQRYRLGLELTNLSFRVLYHMDLRREALPYMKQIVQEWNEACDLSVFDRNEISYIESLPSNRVLNAAPSVGLRSPAHATASGKVFLAYLSPSELEIFLKQPLVKYTQNTLTSAGDLCKALEKIRDQGYGVDMEEFNEGVCAVAAPIFNRLGQVVAVMAGPTPVSRNTPERLQAMAAAYCEATRAISHRLGWKG